MDFRLNYNMKHSSRKKECPGIRVSKFLPMVLDQLKQQIKCIDTNIP